MLEQPVRGRRQDIVVAVLKRQRQKRPKNKIVVRFERLEGVTNFDMCSLALPTSSV